MLLVQGRFRLAAFLHEETAASPAQLTKYFFHTPEDGFTVPSAGIELLGNPRFSDARRLAAFLHGETAVSPTPFRSIPAESKIKQAYACFICALSRNRTYIYSLGRSCSIH